MSEQYDIYHLKYAVLQRMVNDKAINLPSHLESRHKKLVEVFLNLINKGEIRKALNAGDKRALHFGWSKIRSAAQYLLDNGWYEHVGIVSCNSALEAIRETTSINVLWFLGGKKHIDVLGNPNRSTAPLDLIRVNGREYLYVIGGFYSLQDDQFVGVSKWN